jgi:hypothetical protein
MFALSSEMGPPTPPLASECVPPLCIQKVGGGEQHSLAGEGVGGPNSDDWIESLTLCTLCCIKDIEVKCWRDWKW